MFRYLWNKIKNLFSGNSSSSTVDNTFDEYREGYHNLWSDMTYNTGILNSQKEFFLKYYHRYETVKKITGVPIPLIYALHQLESSGKFDCNLMNGQPLHQVTTMVPRGYGPWPTWEASAVDALNLKKAYYGDWTVERMLYFAERYNGFGYRNKGINTPYLWGKTNHYTKGKYIRDGVYNPYTVSNQIGAAVYLAEVASWVRGIKGRAI